MKRAEHIGLNRTGIGMSPMDTTQMLRPTVAPPAPQGGLATIVEFRSDYLQQADAIGSLPPPSSFKGAATTAMQMLRGERPEVFIDKLGARIAFERMGTRLYDLLLAKVSMPRDAGVTLPREELETIRQEELEHFEMLVRIAHDIGVDPTVMTPSADIAGVLGMGLVQVLADPRTDLTQSLEAILVAELADTDSWTLLARLAEAHGLEAIAAEFQRAEETEKRHLVTIRELLSQLTMGKARVLQ